jgi:nicotinate (nicotinamide) nucleotide adenylyltransferase
MNQRNDKFRFLRQTAEEFNRLRTPSIWILRKAPQGISNQEGRLGIFPASFNPPTKAHVALIREARKQTPLDEVLVLLDLQAMDKELTGASWEDRIAMLKVLFRRDSKISIGLSNRGLFAEKIKPLRRIYPASVELTFIVGFDTIERVMNQKYYSNRKKSLDALFEECRFFVANRGGRERNAIRSFFERLENRKYRNRVSYLTLHFNYSAISSSLAREEVKKGKPVYHLLLPSVCQFIEKNGLYRS